MASPVSQPIVTHVQQQQPVMAASPLVMPSPRMPATSIQVKVDLDRQYWHRSLYFYHKLNLLILQNKTA
jgi:hypothetical protein